MGVERRRSVTRLTNDANLLCGDERHDLNKAFIRLGNGSCVNRKIYARFCGGAQGEIPWAYSPNRKLLK